MDAMIYYLVLGAVRLLQALPLHAVAWFGRRVGGLVYWLDARHRRVALDNLTQAFRNEKTRAEIYALAHEHFRRIGETYASAIKVASMTPEAVARHVQFIGARKVLPHPEQEPRPSRLVAIAHLGNFELIAWTGHFVPGYTPTTTYRGLRQPRLDALLRSSRERAGCLVFERRQEGAELLKILRRPGLMVGLLADQHAGRGGLRLPFFGRECSTVAAPAILAQRYKMPLHTLLCFRVGLARWRVEFGDEIPTHQDGRRRSPEEIMTEVNQRLEVAIRRDPANWFWVHRRWKPDPELARLQAEAVKAAARQETAAHEKAGGL